MAQFSIKCPGAQVSHVPDLEKSMRMEMDVLIYMYKGASGTKEVEIKRLAAAEPFFVFV